MPYRKFDILNLARYCGNSKKDYTSLKHVNISTYNPRHDYHRWSQCSIEIRHVHGISAASITLTYTRAKGKTSLVPVGFLKGVRDLYETYSQGLHLCL